MRERAGSTTMRLRQALNRSLFKETPADAVRFHGWEGALAAIAFLALLMALHLLRAGPTDALNSLWAEDGAIFLQGAMTLGSFDALTSTYAGYVVVVPRLIAETAMLAPLGDAPVVVNLASLLVVGLSGLAVWAGSAGHIHSPFLRGLLAALTVLSPVASLEAVVSASYVSWYMLFASFWLLLWRPATTWGAVAAGLFVLATALSTPGIVFLIPLGLLRAIAVRDRHDAVIAGAFTIGLAIQLPVTALSDESAVDPGWSSAIGTAYLQRVVDGGVLGEHLGGIAWGRWGWPFLIALVAAAALSFLLALRAAGTGRLLALIAVVTSIGMFAVSAYQRAAGEALRWPADVHFGFGGRYAIVPALLLVSAILVLLDPREGSARPGVRRWAVAGVTAVLLAGLVTSFDVSDPEVRTMAPWNQSLDEAASACGEGIGAAPIFIAPPGTAMYVTCERLESRYGAALAP